MLDAQLGIDLSAIQFHLRMVSQRGPHTNGLLKLIKILIAVVNAFGLKSLNLEFILSSTNVGCTTWHRPNRLSFVLPN